MSVNKEYLTWPAYLKLINTLHRKINWKKEKFSYLVAISRGGNIIGTILSHKTKLPLHILNPLDPLPKYPKILLVDEVSDSGRTLTQLLKTKTTQTDCKIATLHMKKDTAVVPDYFVKINTQWVVYPYEVD